MADYYAVLGVSNTASEDEIKRAYRKLSRKYHPDIAGPQYEDKFKEVNNAYAVLSDPQKRKMYDAGVDPNDPNAAAGQQAGFDMGDVGDIFGQFFGGAFSGGGQGPVPRTTPGRDALASTTIDLKTVVFGGTAHLKISTFGLCPECGGKGTADGSTPVTCPDCNGRGYRQRVVRTMFGQMMSQAACERCKGHGTIIEHPCTSCMGHGRVRTTREIGVQIPAGITDDARIRLSGQGEVGEGGGAAGDLYVDVHVARDRTFTRDGDDLHCWLQIPMSWAVLGHTATIDTFDGKRDLQVPAGSQPDEVLMLHGLGVAKMRQPTERGDLLAHIAVTIPTKLSEHERTLMEGFAKERQDESQEIRQHSQPATPSKKGFFSKLKDALK